MEYIKTMMMTLTKNSHSNLHLPKILKCSKKKKKEKEKKIYNLVVIK